MFLDFSDLCTKLLDGWDDFRTFEWTYILEEPESTLELAKDLLI